MPAGPARKASSFDVAPAIRDPTESGVEVRAIDSPDGSRPDSPQGVVVRLDERRQVRLAELGAQCLEGRGLVLAEAAYVRPADARARVAGAGAADRLGEHTPRDPGCHRRRTTGRSRCRAAGSPPAPGPRLRLVLDESAADRRRCVMLAPEPFSQRQLRGLALAGWHWFLWCWCL